ncbi:MAG: valine--tRNA ligase [Patescibacteria group bacterium]|nr:valine--tRNA ligase [Patescibacteria group bacterium]
MGEKNIKISNGVNKDLPKAYNPQDYEDKIYEKWEKSGYFNPDICVREKVCAKNAKPFSIVLPPPNVTGHLHLGHAVMLALQDIMVRYHRMKGDKTLWVPGTDHAAIATQSKVESLLWEKEKKTRHDLGRAEFLKRVEKFAKDSHDTIIKQSKKMGASLDWSREVYTLDEKRSLAVRTAFKKMYDDGLIYHGSRIVNWDPKMQTTVSDDEVEWKEEKTPFYYLKYGPFVIATARPETKFGDKYVVMHPDDKRYKKYKHGEKIELEWINGPVVATVIKDKVIDREFGSGVMTITPWHDAIDFEIAQRHNLDKEQIIDKEGKLLPIAGEFAGLEIKKAREKIVAKLKKKGLLVKVEENYIHNIAINARGGSLIEPQIMKQWFIGVNKEFKRGGKKTTLKKLMQEAVRSGKIKIIPERFNKVYFHWIDNLRDWCISRQIWFGHQIPVWYKKQENKKTRKQENSGEEVYVGIDPPKGEEWIQDGDTLDTWFSSGLWTFSPLGWPKKTEDLKTYHPTSVMETGYDILFFWVARMILMTTYLLDDIPFKTVYLHGLIRDEKGKKMSKSLGNAIDPLEVIKKYGTDAVRLSLVIGSTPGNDVKLTEEKIAGYRNFTNKLWNISRFIMQNAKVKNQNDNSKFKIDYNKLTLADNWILEELDEVRLLVDKKIKGYEFSAAGEILRDFTWDKFADWYLEIAKIEGDKSNILIYVLKNLLILWHPFMPFVTEAIWSSFVPLSGTTEDKQDNLLMVEKWPKVGSSISVGVDARDGGAMLKKDEMNLIKDIITSIRNARAENKVEPGKKVKAVIYAGHLKDLVGSQVDLIKGLRTGISELEVKEKGEKIENEIYIAISGIEIYLIGGIDKNKEKERIKKEIDNLEKMITAGEKRLKNKEFRAKAPAEIVKKEEEKLKSFQEALEKLKKQ